jgi:hypothetical protein
MSVFATTRVVIADPLSGRPVGSCRGPRPDGRCSAPCGDRIGCEGHSIVAEMAGGRRRVRLAAPADLHVCPLAPSPSLSRPERRDPHLRSLRDAGADWFGIHPAMLSAVDEPTLARLLRRVRGGYADPGAPPWRARQPGHPSVG